jgi:hypothetical protein
VDFGAAAPGVTFGWHAHGNGVDFTELASATLGAANAGPAIGPVVINEIMYHPATIGASEYIELRNVTGSTVKLYDPANPQNTWQFTDGITFSFPQGAEIPAFGYALVVPTDPETFRTTNDIHPNVPIFGPFTGNLGNGGEKVTLSRPGTPVGLTVPYYRVDRVQYGNAAPWPTAPDGGGPALSRTDGSAYGNDAATWSAEQPGGSMGRENFDATAPTVSMSDLETGAGGSVRITFTELVRGFEMSDLRLTREGADVPLTPGQQTLTTTDGLTYVLGDLLSLMSAPGEYELTLNAATAGINDLANHALAIGASRTFTPVPQPVGFKGTAGNDHWYVKRIAGDQLAVWGNDDGSGAPVMTVPLGHPVSMDGLAGDDSITIDLSGGDVQLGELEIVESSGDDVVRVINGDGKVLKVQGLPALNSERLDLGAADLTILGADVSAVEALLKSARNGPTPWQGPGIGTRAATSVAGLVPVQQGADVLVKYSYNGDANGDGKVNADDYFRIDSNFLTPPAAPLYDQGDFNFDDTINADDYFLIDSAFLGQGAPLGSTATASAAVAASASTSASSVTADEQKKATKRSRGAATAASVFSDVRVTRKVRAGR